MNKDNYIDSETMTPEELERLVQAWESCELTREEEMMLRKVLASSDIHSPSLDECRLAMGLESMLSDHKPRRGRIHVPFWLRAASVTLLLACGSWAAIHFTQPKKEIIVYIGGKKVSDPHQAAVKAYHDMAEMQQEANRIKNEAVKERELQRIFIEKSYIH